MNTRRGLKQSGLTGRWGLWSGIVGLLALLASLVAPREPLGTAASVSLATVNPVTVSVPSPPDPSQDRARVAAAYEQVPLTFEPNQGQTDAAVQFLARGRGYTVFLTASEVVLVWQPGDAPPSPAAQDRSGPPPRGRRALPAAPATPPAGAVLRWQFTGAVVPTPTAWEGLEPQPGQSNYFIGNDPSRWRTGVTHYGRVRSAQRYPGIDVVFYGNPRQLEYDWVVAPGADPTAIRLTVQGADRVRVDAEGNLVLTLAGRELIQPAPRVYQEIEGSRRPLAGRYVLLDPPGEPATVAIPHYTVGFQVGAYDTTRPLVIDPVLVYSTYLGGSGSDEGGGIAVDSAGNAYVTGGTRSTDFPTQNAVQATLRGELDAFVTRFTPTGQLVYSTYLGGSGSEGGTGIAVDSAGYAYVTGWMLFSTDFPTRNAFQATFRGGWSDAFVTRFTPTGQLVYSTYLGGSQYDSGEGIAVDSAGHAYVTGETVSANFPTRNAFQATFRGGSDAFVTRFTPTGQLAYSTYLGGSNNDIGYGIAVDSAGHAYVTGYTVSANFPTRNAVQATLRGGAGAFVTQLADNACATEVSSQVSVTRGGFRFNWATGHFGQVVTLTNTGATPVPATLSLVLDNLSSDVTLDNPTGSTTCATPVGSPYRDAPVGSDNLLSPGEEVTVVLEFTNSSQTQGITYTTRVLAGVEPR